MNKEQVKSENPKDKTGNNITVENAIIEVAQDQSGVFVQKGNLINRIRKAKVFGKNLDSLIIGSVGGAAVKKAVKYSLYAAGFKGYLLAAGVGGLSGALWKGGKELYVESKRDFEKDELDDVLSKLKENKKTSAQDRVAKYLELVADKKTDKKLSEEKRKLRDELKKELKLNSVRWKKVARASLRGAVIGAFGGLVGAAIFDAIGGFSDVHAVENVVGHEPAVITAPSSPEIAQTIIDEKKEAFVAVYEDKMAGLSKFKGDEVFSSLIHKGEGVTHAARSAVHDYLSQMEKLDPSFDPASVPKENLIYAEDYLKDFVLAEKGSSDYQAVLGEKFDFSLARIQEALERAKSLSPAQMENIKSQFVAKISEDTWNQIQNYAHIDNLADNDFASKILQEANDKAIEAGNCAAEEIAEAELSLEEKIAGDSGEKTELRETVAKAAHEFLNSDYLKYGLSALGLAISGALTLRGIKSLLKPRIEKRVLNSKTKETIVEETKKSETVTGTVDKVSEISLTAEEKKEGKLRFSGVSTRVLDDIRRKLKKESITIPDGNSGNITIKQGLGGAKIHFEIKNGGILELRILDTTGLATFKNVSDELRKNILKVSV